MLFLKWVQGRRYKITLLDEARLADIDGYGDSKVQGLAVKVKLLDA